MILCVYAQNSGKCWLGFFKLQWIWNNEGSTNVFTGKLCKHDGEIIEGVCGLQVISTYLFLSKYIISPEGHFKIKPFKVFRYFRGMHI